MKGRHVVSLLLASFASIVTAAYAQEYPSQPIRVIVPFPAGGATDVVARLAAQGMTESLGRPVIVDNRSGAGGTIGAAVVAKAAPDGHTLLLHNSAFVPASTIHALANRLSYNLEKDFAPITMLVSVPGILIAHPSVPAKDLKELAQWLKANPGKAYGSTGPGALSHLWPELYKSLTGVEVQHVPYKGAAPAMQDLLAGRVVVMFDQLSNALPHVRGGKVRAVVVTTAQRSGSLPEVSTTREQGYPQLEVVIWNSLFAPAATPAAIVQRIHADAVKAIRQPAVVARLQDLAADAVGSTPEEFNAIFREQIARWTPVIKKLGITPD